jgi:hypothetical protein
MGTALPHPFSIRSQIAPSLNARGNNHFRRSEVYLAPAALRPQSGQSTQRVAVVIELQQSAEDRAGLVNYFSRLSNTKGLGAKKRIFEKSGWAGFRR